jgi:enamine deaminase RidA (YjgF/YER057c/UK114 family)
MTHELLNPPLLPFPRGFSHAVVTGGGKIVFVAGQIGCDEKGTVTSTDLVEQFTKALENLMVVIAASGGGPESIARLTIYVTEMVEYRARLKGIGQAYRSVMGKHYPAMALIEVKGLFEPTSKIELEATAVI